MTPEKDIPILHHDSALVVIDKPPGLLSVPGIGPERQDCAVSRVQAAFPGARVVHRLDRDTSGVLVLAFGADVHRELSRQFHDREVEKRYVALVAGRMEKMNGEIDLPMRKDMNPKNAPRQIVDFAQGREAITGWRVLPSFEPGSEGIEIVRLELRPVTGRSHQLRLHLQAIGHPILGDDLYAPPEVLALADRLMLHAESLTVTHPATGERMTLTAPCPF